MSFVKLVILLKIYNCTVKFQLIVTGRTTRLPEENKESQYLVI